MTATRQKRENVAKWISEVIDRAIEMYDFEHTDKRHVNRSAKFLQQRICVEGNEQATSFYGPVDKIHDAIVSALKEDADLITYWISKSQSDRFVELEHPMPRGIMGRGFKKTGLHEWSKGSLQCDYFRIVLCRDQDMSIQIVTAYPVF